MFGRVQHGQGGGGGGARVCSFYQQGRCKFGDNCKFEHPGANKPQDTGNRFQALGNNSFGQGNRNNQRPPAPGRGEQYNSQNSYAVTKEGIEGDLRNERPKWPFSAYGPGRDAPLQLFGGFPLEQSPEEMRVLYYQAIASGNPQPAIQGEQELITQTNQQIERALADLDGAVRYILDGENQHPNRIDGCQAAVGNVFHKGRKLNSKFSSTAAPAAANAPAQSGGFGQPSAMGSGGGAFGQPSSLGGGGGFGQASNLGQKPNPFGQSGNAVPAVGGFGSASTLGQKPSPFGQPAAGGFGQASNLGAKPNPFGQPAAQAGGFGQPSALGQGNAFGQPSGGAQPSPFAQAAQPNQAQPSPFAQAGQQGGGFGQASVLGQQQKSAFGQPSGLGQQPQPAFGQPSVPSQQNTAFGQSSVPGQNSAFGQPSASGQQTSAFGQPSAPAQGTPAFGQAPAPLQQNSAFGQPAVPTPQNGVFGQASAPVQQQNAFGQPQTNQQPQPSPFAQAAAKPSPFGQPSQPANGQAVKPNPFGQPPQPANNQAGGAFGQVAPAPQSEQQQQSYAEPMPQGEWITRHANGAVRTFKGAAVQYVAIGKEGEQTQEPHYRDANGNMERIWHPEGNAAFRAEMEAPAEAYTTEHEAAYKFMAEQGTFKDGIMPEIPPKCEWIRWDV
ncbi:hypothetical protein D6D15_03575 [Aureobasidium pullulans]|uniref:C3H1-type domain-containing protein n=1 Tax=Aureobasidium pullulans TaxID=5580 RepID=A0A4V4IW41_AURPU|nr:hypothetical protein D6D15_03575 [Aureobasidium pullulans]